MVLVRSRLPRRFGHRGVEEPEQLLGSPEPCSLRCQLQDRTCEQAGFAYHVVRLTPVGNERLHEGSTLPAQTRLRSGDPQCEVRQAGEVCQVGVGKFFLDVISGSTSLSVFESRRRRFLGCACEVSISVTCRRNERRAANLLKSEMRRSPRKRERLCA